MRTCIFVCNGPRRLAGFHSSRRETRQAARLLDITDISVEEITPTYHKVGESNHFTRKCQSFHPTTDSEFGKKKKEKWQKVFRSAPVPLWLCDAAKRRQIRNSGLARQLVCWDFKISGLNPSPCVLKGSFIKSVSENDYTDRHLSALPHPCGGMLAWMLQ